MLLVAFDVESIGALATVTASAGLLATALVLAPEASERTVAAFDWTLVDRAAMPNAAPSLASSAARSLAGNAMAGALPFLETLAHFDTPSFGTLALPLSATLSLSLQGQPFARQSVRAAA